MSFLKRLPIGLLLGLCLSAAAFAQENTPPKVSVSFDPKLAQAGRKLTVEFTVTFGEGLHAYQNPPTTQYQIPLEVTCATKGVGFKVIYPKGVVKNSMGEQTAVYEGTIKVPVQIMLPKKTGKTKLDFAVAYQQCNETTCFPPGKVDAPLKIVVLSAKGKGR